MNNLGDELVKASRMYIGAAFRHHYEPENLCSSGVVTLDNCMENGLGQDNQFDCSGLVIASICEVLGISASQWPREYRHAKQLIALEEASKSRQGDIATFREAGSSRVHLGILVASMTVVHASGLTGRVEEGKVLGNFPRIHIIPAAKLLEIGSGLQISESRKAIE